MTESRPVETADGPAPSDDLSTTGLAGWMMTADHKRIGRLYMVTGLLSLIGGLGIAIALGLEKLDPTSTAILRDDTIDQLIAAYRDIVPFLGIAPFFLGLLIAVVPLQVGARSVAFPRAAALSFWLWLTGAGILVGAYLANGGPGGGEPQAVDLYLLGLGVAVVGLGVGAVCVATTVMALRAPGMRMDWVPLLSWSGFVTAVAWLLTFPVLVGDLVYLYVDHRYGRIVFGGNDGISAHLAWATRQPAIFVFALPAFGVIADVISTLAGGRQRLQNALMTAIGLAGILSLGGWVNEQLNPNVLTDPVFIVYSVAAVIPGLALLVFAGAGLRDGSVKVATPLMWAFLAGLMVLTAGGVAALYPIDGLGLVGTVYEQAQSDYVLLGQGLLAIGAALFLWLPKLTGRRLPDLPGRLLAFLGFLGIVAYALPNVVLGFIDQPASSVSFPEESASQALNAVSLVGAVLLTLTVVGLVLLVIGNLAGSGEAAGDDPWTGHTLEWATTSPPPETNFAGELPVVRTPQPLLDARLDAREVV